MLLLLMALVVFLLAMALDYATASYYDAVKRKAGHEAARYSVAMGAIGTVAALSVFKLSLWLIIPELAGLYLGTYMAVKDKSNG